MDPIEYRRKQAVANLQKRKIGEAAAIKIEKRKYQILSRLQSEQNERKG